MGEHINVLLITLFFKHFRPLIEAGRVYTVVAPLYKLEKGKEVKYVSNDYELSKINTKGYNITRFKGLGEMTADQLHDTIMDRTQRILKRVTISDALKAEKVIENLMGKKVEPRKDFIQKNAHKAKIVI